MYKKLIMKTLSIILYTISFISIPGILGWLTIGRGSFPEPIILQWLFGWVVIICIFIFVGFFILGLYGIKSI